MKPIAQTYTAKQDYEVFEDGKYTVTGIEWFSLDEDSNPILVGQSDGKLVGRFNFTLVDGTEGPPHSVTLGEMPLIVKAFGGNITNLPNSPDLSVPDEVSNYMNKIKEMATGKTTVTVKDGWVRGVAGAEVPTGLYYFKVVGVAPTNKETQLPEPREGKWGEWFLIEFEIVAGEGGSQTPWKGTRFTEFANYAVEVKNGEADWARTKSGDYTANAIQLSHLMLYTAPAMFEEGFEFKDPNNILPDYLNIALKEQKVVKGFRQKNKKGDRVILDLATVEPVTGVAQQEEVKPVKTEVDEDTKARLLIKQLLNLVAGEEAFSNDFELNTAGKVAAKKYLSPLKTAGKIKNGKISMLTYDEISLIFKAVEQDYKDNQTYQEIMEKLAYIGMGFNDSEDY